jgi:hypothetical protein
MIDVDFYPAADAPEAALGEVSGDESLGSDTPNMRASKSTVGVLILYYPKQ